MELLLAAHERGVDRSGEGRDVWQQFDQPKGWDRRGLPLQLERLDRLGAGGRPHQPLGSLADKCLAGCGGLFEPGGDVHGVACD